MTTIQIESLESGQHRIVCMDQAKKPWLSGYIAVPAHLESSVEASCGFCDLIIEDGVLVGITPTERPPEPIPEPTADEQISALKEALESTDYQIIKCSEYQLAGLDMPYDLAALHESRQALRDQINVLEGLNE